MGVIFSQSLDEIRPTYCFNETCQETVPQATIAFLESTDFEDAIRNAISLVGTVILSLQLPGSIAEASYGIPDWITDKAYTYLDEPLKRCAQTMGRIRYNQIIVYIGVCPYVNGTC